MDNKNKAYAFLGEALNLALDKFNKKEWEQIYKVTDSTQNYDKKTFQIPDFQKLVIATSIFTINEDREKAGDLTDRELELFAAGFALEKFAAFSNKENFSLKEKLDYFDKEILNAILNKKLSKKEGMELIWGMDEEFYETGLEKEKVLNFINDTSKKGLGDFMQKFAFNSADHFEKNQSEVEKICL